MNNLKISLNLLLVIVLLFFGSCRTRKEIIEPIKAKDEGAEYLFNQLKKNELKFDWISAKFSTNFIADKKSNSVSGHIRMCCDSAIWVSLSPALGIEIARVLITVDSVKLLNRINKTYFVGDFKYLNELLNTDLDFDILQSLIVGNDFTYYENDVFKARVFNKLYHLSTVGRRKLKKYVKNEQEDLRVLVQDMFLDPETYKIQKLILKIIQKENRKLEANYSNYRAVQNQLFPHTVKYNVISEKMIDIKINYSNVTLDEEQSFPFKIPEKYSKLI
ncbi:MAG: DUF4292 domain-containing protein [Saprospiraceae bacterium]|nr:DUF4292 domain-containing protein [Saprospiraceae bacterium]